MMTLPGEVGAQAWAFVTAELQYVVVVMRYLHARDGLDFVTLLVNGVIALYIAIRLVFAGIRPGETVERPVRWLRAAVFFAYAWIALRIWTGHYQTPVDSAEVIPNLGVAWVVYVYRGDLRALWRTLADALEKRRAERRPVTGGR